MAQFRINKTKDFTIMSNYPLYDKSLSNKSKGLLCTMLSLPPDWNYTVKGLSTICPRDGPSSIHTQIEELEKSGYLLRGQERTTNGRFAQSIFEVFEVPWWLLPEDIKSKIKIPMPDKPLKDLPLTGNPISGISLAEKPITESNDILNTKESNTNQLNTYLINNQSINLDRSDRNGVEELIKDNIEFDIISYTIGEERLQGIVNIIVDTICSSKDTIRINHEEIPRDVVAKRFLELDSDLIQYAVDCMDENPSKVKGHIPYILTVLYNAKSTIGNYFCTLYERNTRYENNE